MVQFLRIRLQMQRMRVWSLVREVRSHVPCAIGQWSPRATTMEPTCSGAHMPQLENLSAATREKSIHCNERSRMLQLRSDSAKEINTFFFFKKRTICIEEVYIQVHVVYIQIHPQTPPTHTHSHQIKIFRHLTIVTLESGRKAKAEGGNFILLKYLCI